MKLFIKLLIIFFVLIFSIIIIFLFWASSGISGKKPLSGIKIFTENINDVIKKQPFTIMTYNCGYFSGMRNNIAVSSSKDFYIHNLDNFIKILREHPPEIICFQEIDFNSKRSHYINQMDYLSGYLKYKYGAYAVNWNKRYVPFPYWPPSAHFKKILSGQSVLSVFPIRKSNRIVLEMPKNPFYYNLFYLNRLIQTTEIKINNKIIIVMNIHLEAFDKKTREKQSAHVLKYYRKNFKNKFPVIILGDFNCVRPDAEKKNNFEDEPETDYYGEKTIELFLDEESLTSAMPYSKPDSNTFPSVNPDRKLDFIFFTKNKIEMIKSDILHVKSSDHLPLLMQFNLK
ncbi:MAG: endonuclease/exonuclease/phosphatase family protein [Acidobacteriota bacterium]